MFDINEDYSLILNSIIGLLVIDVEGKIVFIDEKTVKLLQLESREEAIGKDIRSFFNEEENRLYNVVKTGKAQIGEVYIFDGLTIISNGYPIYKNGKLVGAFEYDVFESPHYLNTFFKKLDSSRKMGKTETESSGPFKLAKYTVEDILGVSESVVELKQTIEEIANTDSNIVIFGETGCGKELVANAIHCRSHRNLKPFVAINCASVPSGLFESELFGYEEGSFTGAVKGGRKGKVEIANGGTLFLDEIDQLPRVDQPKLLRFLQEKEIMKVGGKDNIEVDVRIVCATNRNLREMVTTGEFREDLYYRINVVEIPLTPLRERKEDIMVIARDVLQKLKKSLGSRGKKIRGIDETVEEILCAYDWPGNVRELQNVMERAMSRCDGEILQIEHFKDFMRAHHIIYDVQSESPPVSLRDAKAAAEKRMIVEAYEKCGRNKSETARMLGISRTVLYDKMKKLGID